MNEKEHDKDINSGPEGTRERYSFKRELKKTSLIHWFPGIIAGLLLLSISAGENAEEKRILEVESEYNTNIENNAIDISSFENESQTKEIESYHLKVGDDINPGLYSVVFTSIEHQPTFVDVEIVRNGDYLNFFHVETEDQQLVVNLDLKQYDQISLKFQASVPVQVLLTLQDDFIAYNNDDYGIYTSPELIDSKTHTVNAKSNINTYGYDEYQRLENIDYAYAEEEISIKDNQYVVVQPDMYT